MYTELDLMGAETADLNLVDYNAGEKAFFRRAVTKVCMFVFDGAFAPQHSVSHCIPGQRAFDSHGWSS